MNMMNKMLCFFCFAVVGFNSLINADDYPGYGSCKTCYDGFTGDQCNQPLCYGYTTCLNGGNCLSPNNCTCLHNYVGNRCEQAVCFGATTCANGGTCVSPDTCSCTREYTGQNCETENEIKNGGRRAIESAMTAVVLLTTSLHMFAKHL